MKPRRCSKRRRNRSPHAGRGAPKKAAARGHAGVVGLGHRAEIDRQSAGMARRNGEGVGGALGWQPLQDGHCGGCADSAEHRGGVPAFAVIVPAAPDEVRPHLVARHIGCDHVLATRAEQVSASARIAGTRMALGCPVSAWSSKSCAWAAVPLISAASDAETQKSDRQARACLGPAYGRDFVVHDPDDRLGYARHDHADRIRESGPGQIDGFLRERVEADARQELPQIFGQSHVSTLACGLNDASRYPAMRDTVNT